MKRRRDSYPPSLRYASQLIEQSIEFAQQAGQLGRFWHGVKLADGLNAHVALLRELSALIDDGLHARYKDELQPLRIRQRVQGKSAGEAILFWLQRRVLPEAEAFQLRFDFGQFGLDGAVTGCYLLVFLAGCFTLHFFDHAH